MASAEPQVRFHNPMPAGYQFVPKGDVYMTNNCRVKTREAGQTVYVVISKNKKALGLRCPQNIIDQVTAAQQATAAFRAAAVRKKDDAIEDEFRNEVLRVFPDVPRADLPAILKQTLRKRSGRVGRTGTRTLEQKVEFAVIAHIRHSHTDYDELLKSGVAREEARRRVAADTSQTAHSWGRREKMTNVTLQSKSKSTLKPKPKPKKRSRPKTKKGVVQEKVSHQQDDTGAPTAQVDKSSQLAAVAITRRRVTVRTINRRQPASRVIKQSSSVYHARQAQVMLIDNSDDSDDDGPGRGKMQSTSLEAADFR